MKLTDKDLRICLVAYLLTAASLAWSHDSGPEYIESFDTALQVRDSGALDVTHVIDVHPHGDEIRRGLFFELPDDVGRLHAFSVRVDSQPVEAEFDDGAIIAAAPEPLARHEQHRFVIRYRADAPWWLESPGTARLRWRPVIEQFELAWRTASLDIQWPAGRAPLDVPDRGAVDANTWRIRMKGPAAAEAATPPVGAVELRWDAAGLPADAVRRHGTDWGWRTALVAAVLALLGFLHLAWRAVGRDPDPGNVPTRSEPPDGLSPAATRFVDRMGFDNTAFVAALVSLRVKGAIELSVGEDRKTLHIARKRSDAALSPGEKALSDRLFSDASSVELGPGSSLAQHASSALRKRLGTEHRGRHFVTNNGQRVQGIVAGIVVIGLGLAALVAQLGDPMTPDPIALAVAVVALAAGVAAPLVYFDLFKAPTRAGMTVKRQVLGLKRYLAGKTSLGRDARHFVELLPYAIALDAEEEWRDRFEEELDDEAAPEIAEVLEWYREVQRRAETAGAIVPILAATSGATAATSAGAAGGASAGGV